MGHIPGAGMARFLVAASRRPYTVAGLFLLVGIALCATVLVHPLDGIVGIVLLAGLLAAAIVQFAKFNVAGRTQAEESLQASETRYRTLFNASRDATMLRTIDRKIVAANPAAVQLFGCKDESELCSLQPNDIYPDYQPDGRLSVEKAIEAMQIAMRDGSCAYEWTYKRRDGSEFVASVVVTKMVLEGQTFFLSTTRDITEQKRAQRALEDSERRLAAIIEFLPDGTFAVDCEGRIIAWNHAMEELSDVPASEMLGKGDYAYAVPLYGTRHPIMIDCVFRGHEELWKDFDYLEQRGNRFVAERFVPGFYGGKGAYVWGIAGPLYDSEGRVVGAIESFRDITEQKRAADALRASETKYRTLYDVCGDAILVRRPDRSIVSANRAAVAMFGCKDESELLEMTTAERSPEYQPDGQLSSEKAPRMFDAVLRGGVSLFEWTYRRKDGTLFDTMNTLTVMNLDSETLHLNTFRDITQQKLAEKALQASETKYKTLYDATSDAILLRSPDRRVIGANPAAVALFGYRDEDELKSVTPADLYAEYQPDGQLSSEKAPQMAEIAMRDGSHSFEWKYKRRDGSEFLANVLWTRMEVENQNILLTTIRDITEQRRAEEAFHASQRRLRLFADNVTAVIWSTDINARFTYMSPSVEQLLGFKWNENANIGLEDIVTHPSLAIGRDRLRQITEAAQNGQRLKITEELELVRADGSCVWCEVTANGAFDEAGQLVGFLGITHDITERKLAEERRATSLRRLEGMNRLQEDLLLPGSMAKKFAKITETAIQLLELDSCRIWLMKPGDICQNGCIHGGTPPAAICPAQEECLHLLAGSGQYSPRDDAFIRVPLGAFEIGRIASGEMTKFLTNEAASDPEVGDRQWVKETGLVGFAAYRLRDAEGCVAGVLAMFAKHRFSEEEDALMAALAETTSRVIIEQKAAEELRMSQTQAIEANRAKSRFLATMSHEIRTPMTAILGYADLLMDPHVSSENQSNYATIIRRSGEHLLALINDILDLSKIEAGKMLLEWGRCNVVALVADMVSLLRPRAEQRGISLSVQYSDAIPETIRTDTARLRQAIVNLVGNAIKFTEQGGVRIVVAFLPDGCQGEPAIRFDVIDTGVGIHPEIIPQLFQPFSQGDVSVAQRFGGTGLGLAISHNIAQMLGGTLTVVSNLKQGSDFTLTVPTGSLEGVSMLQNPTEVIIHDVTKPTAPERGNLRGSRILVAEDGIDNRELIQTVLERAGAEVQTAEDGHAALDKARQMPFDLILMDMNMPEMDGYEATGALRDRGYRGPILALTANAMIGDSERCLAVGCDGYLSKPINRAQLIQTIATFIVVKETVGEKDFGQPV